MVEAFSIGIVVKVNEFVFLRVYCCGICQQKFAVDSGTKPRTCPYCAAMFKKESGKPL
jgi:uncharacterized CHY-type Zn-finger protein